jgi:hypothetical protein
MAEAYLKAPVEDGGLGLDDAGMANLFRTRDAMSATALIFQATKSYHARQSVKALNSHRAPVPQVQRPSGRGMSSPDNDRLASLRGQLGKGSQKSQLTAAAEILTKPGCWLSRRRLRTTYKATWPTPSMPN